MLYCFLKIKQGLICYTMGGRRRSELVTPRDVFFPCSSKANAVMFQFRGYVCMVITYSRVWIKRVRLLILLVVSWTGKIIFPCPRACLRIWSREMGSAVPSRVSLLISILRLNLVCARGTIHDYLLDQSLVWLQLEIHFSEYVCSTTSFQKGYQT